MKDLTIFEIIKHKIKHDGKITIEYEFDINFRDYAGIITINLTEEETLQLKKEVIKKVGEREKE